MELPKVKGNFYIYGSRFETVYFMMRRKLLHRIDGCVWSYQSYDDGGMWWYQSCDDEVYDATNHMMTGVGGGASRTMMICGATESILTVNLIISISVVANRYETVYFEAKYVRVCSRVLCIYLGGISLTINIPMVVYFVYVSRAKF